MTSVSEEFNRKMPFSLEAEQSVLGSVLIDPETFNSITGNLAADDFYLEEHREIYAAMQELFLSSREIDIVTLIDMLVKRGVYENTDQSRNYIKVIAEIVPTASNIGDYANIVREKALLRRLIEACGEITNDAYTAKGNVPDILETAESKIFSIAEKKDTHEFVSIQDVLVSVYDHLKQLSDDPEGSRGTPTGFGDLDNVLVGMAPGDLVLVGARPAMGKTAFCLNIGTNVARRTKKTVAIFSLEMSAEQLVTRMLSSEGMINSHNLRTGKLSPEEWNQLATTSAALSDCKILIDDTTGITVSGMKAKLRRVKNLGLVIVDYLQLMQGERHTDNRVNEVADISRGLKLLGKELKVPVLCCAQLSRASEKRDSKVPQLSDLRDSGSIEQDADVVMFLHRPEYYGEQGKDANGQTVMNLANVVIAKNRHGETKTVNMRFIGAYTRFMSAADLSEAPPEP